jgi:hypothetical protein
MRPPTSRELGGSARGERWVMARLSAGLPYDTDRDGIDRTVKAAAAAAQFSMAAAVAPLRALLASAAPVANGTAVWPVGADFKESAPRVYKAAAEALVSLGDAGAASSIEEHARVLERTGRTNDWKTWFSWITKLDPPRAARYAREKLDGAGSLGDAPWLDLALEAIVAAGDRAALPGLARLALLDSTRPHERCSLDVARLSLGEEAFTKRLRRSMVGPQKGPELVRECEPRFIRAVLGARPGDAAILLRYASPGDELGEPPHRSAEGSLDSVMVTDRAAHEARFESMKAAYGQLFGQVAHARDPATSAEERARTEADRAALLAGLRGRASGPEAVGNERRQRGLRNTPDWRAMELQRLALLAGLEDEPARASLYAAIDDPRDDTPAPFLAARFALELRLPEAIRHARELFSRGVRAPNRFRTSPFREARVRFFDAFVELAPPTDTSWAAAVFDQDEPTRQHAVSHLARKRPAAACSVVLDTAREQETRALPGAFHALTPLAEACAVDFLRLAQPATPVVPGAPVPPSPGWVPFKRALPPPSAELVTHAVTMLALSRDPRTLGLLHSPGREGKSAGHREQQIACLFRGEP